DNRGRVLPNELDRTQRADIKQRTARRDRKADRGRGCRTVVAITDALRFNPYPCDVGARRDASSAGRELRSGHRPLGGATRVSIPGPQPEGKTTSPWPQSKPGLR